MNKYRLYRAIRGGVWTKHPGRYLLEKKEDVEFYEGFIDFKEDYRGQSLIQRLRGLV